MNSPAIEVKDILEDFNIGTFARDLFVSQMPETPDVCMCVYDSGGFAPDSDNIYERPTVQVAVRGAAGKYEEAYGKAASIKNILHDLHNESWGTSRYIGIWAMSDVLFLGYDEKNRPLLTVNFRIHRTTTT